MSNNTVDCVDFFTPVRFEGAAATVGQQALTLIDSLFYFGGRVAIVAPEYSENERTATILQEEEMSWWQTAVKLAACAVLVLPGVSILTWAIPAALLVSKAVFRFGYDFRVCGQKLADGVEEIGAIVQGVLAQGVRKKADEVAFINPKLLLGEVKLEGEGIELNFAEVFINKKREVIPVQKPCDSDGSGRGAPYVRYPGSPYEALLKIAQDKTDRYFWEGNLHYGSPIMHLLQHPNNHLLTAQGVLTFLTSENSEGSLPLHSLNRESLMEALQLAKDHAASIDLHKVDPVTKETMFSKWAGLGFEKLTQKFLEIDPTVISQTKGQSTSFFAKALLEGHEEEARILLQAMDAQKVKLSPRDIWRKKAFSNDCSFTKKSFLKLPDELRHQLLKIANIYVNKDFLLKLRECGMRVPQAPPERASIFSYTMDAIDVEDALRAFFADLRNLNLLLTEEEFSEKEISQYVSKGKDVGRILGRNYMEKEIKRLRLQHVKVPKKMAVIQPEDKERSSIICTVAKNGSMNFFCLDLEIYAEKIVPIQRAATKEVMLEFLELLRVTGFNDFYGYNFFMGRNQAGDEGIYCIDTEYPNFSSMPCFDNIGMACGSLMKKEDHPWLQQELNQRHRDFQGSKEALGEAARQKWQAQKPLFIENGFKDRKLKPFVFPIADLVK